MKKIIFILIIVSLNLEAQANDTLFIYFPLDKNTSVIKKWVYDLKSEKFKIANRFNDSVVFVGRESYIRKRKPKKNIMYIDNNFEYDFFDFFKKIENKKIVIVLSYECRYRYIPIHEIFQYERPQK